MEKDLLYNHLKELGAEDLFPTNPVLVFIEDSAIICFGKALKIQKEKLPSLISSRCLILGHL